MSITASQVLAAAEGWGLSKTADPVAEKLAAYGNLLLQWNARLSLTAIRGETELIERHLMEGVFAAAHHPVAVTVLDFGSGTGVPGVPIAICREDIHVVLAESQKKKAAFLQEAVRQFRLNAHVHAGRAETLPPASFEAVWMRAVDKSSSMLPIAAGLVAPKGVLCLLGTGAWPESVNPDNWAWVTLPLPASQERVLHIGTRN